MEKTGSYFCGDYMVRLYDGSGKHISTNMEDRESRDRAAPSIVWTEGFEFKVESSQRGWSRKPASTDLWPLGNPADATTAYLHAVGKLRAGGGAETDSYFGNPAYSTKRSSAGKTASGSRGYDGSAGDRPEVDKIGMKKACFV